MTNTFLSIVDQNPSTIDAIKTDYAKLAQKYKIGGSDYHSLSQVEKKLSDLIIADFDQSASSNRISVHNLKKVRETLIYRYLLNNEPLGYQINLLETLYAIKSSAIKKMPPFSDRAKWGRIVTNLKDYKLLTNYRFNIDFRDLRNHHPQEYDRAMLLKRLQSNGCEIKIVKDDIEIDSPENATGRIEKLIEKTGGLTVARHIFELLKKESYSKPFVRYHLTRKGNGLNTDHSPQIPYGYILNLCVKYPYFGSSKTSDAAALKEIFELSTAVISGFYNVQHYNQWENYLQTGETIIKFYQDLAVWDSLYSLVQLRPELSMQMVKELFANFPEAVFDSVFNVKRSDYFAVLDAIYDLTKDSCGPVYLYVSKIRARLQDIDRQTVGRILGSLSHKSKPNSDYKIPTEITAVDFQFCPLIQEGQEKFIMMDKSWCAPAFFEAMSAAFRLQKIGNFDNEMGYFIENLIYKSLDSQNITYTHGTYRVDGNDGECDLIFESEDAITTMEFKKKVLTRKARSGTDIDLVIDLSDSLLASQLQAGRTELILRKKGSITIKNEKKKTSGTIHFGKKKIQRISLTQLDFGAFHDKAIIEQFFKALLTHQYGTTSDEDRIRKKFEDLQKKQVRWADLHSKLVTIDSDYNSRPFFNCTFLNLGQLLEIIYRSDDNESLTQNLGLLKSLTYGTLDFYREFELASNLRKHSISLKPAVK